jgi:hypothetical protein
MLAYMNAVMASSSTFSTKYALKTSLRLHPLLFYTYAIMIESLTSPF